MALKLPPCKKCPYRLGEIQTLTNPCPDCKISGYKMYEQFKIKGKPMS